MARSVPTGRLFLHRFANEQKRSRKRDHQSKEAKADIRRAPAKVTDKPLGILRDQRRPKADPTHGYAQGQTALVVEPGRNAFRVSERSLARSQETGDRKEKHEHEDRIWRQGKYDDRKQNGPDTPSIDQPTNERDGDRGRYCGQT